MVRVCDLKEALSDLLIEVTTSQARTGHIHTHQYLLCNASTSYRESFDFTVMHHK
jgi:hypothetical protein